MSSDFSKLPFEVLQQEIAPHLSPVTKRLLQVALGVRQQLFDQSVDFITKFMNDIVSLGANILGYVLTNYVIHDHMLYASMVQFGDIESFEHLRKIGRPVLLEHLIERPPLTYLVGRDVSILEYLISIGTLTRDNFDTIQDVAIEYDAVPMLRHLHRKYSIPFTTNHLFRFTRNGQLAALTYALPFVATQRLKGLLMQHAIDNGQVAIVKYLHETGISLTFIRELPIIVKSAVLSRSIECVEYINIYGNIDWNENLLLEALVAWDFAMARYLVGKGCTSTYNMLFSFIVNLEDFYNRAIGNSKLAKECEDCQWIINWIKSR